MRIFIDVTQDDFWTALINRRFIVADHKPKPYKQYAELNMEERIIQGLDEHYVIIFHGSAADTTELVRQSLANQVCESFPKLAKKHKLKKDTTHEFWRKPEERKVG